MAGCASRWRRYKEQVRGYAANEIPDADRFGLRDGQIYQLWRPAAELVKAVPSACGLPILTRHTVTSADDHPADLVIGATMSDAIFDPPYLRVSLTIWDADAISDIESGSVKISAGYEFTYNPEPGVFEGQRFSGRMEDIEFNHIIVCEKGRARARCAGARRI